MKISSPNIKFSEPNLFVLRPLFNEKDIELFDLWNKLNQYFAKNINIYLDKYVWMYLLTSNFLLQPE